MKIIHQISFAILVTLLIACGKDEVVMNVQTNNIQSDIRIEQIIFTTKDTAFLCGGISGEKGEIYLTVNGGNTWNKLFECKDKLYNIAFWNNKAIAVGDCTRIQKSFDNGKTWEHEVKTNYMCDNDKSSLRKVMFYNEVSGVAIGNWNRERGNCFHTWDGGETWSDIHGMNGLEDWWVFGFDSTYACGFGILEKITKIGYQTTILPFSGDYFTGIWFTSNKIGFMCGYDGGIYKTRDGGATWSTVFKKNSLLKKRIHFNDIIFIDDNTGFVVGENGVMYKTNSEGESWLKVNEFTSNSLTGIMYHNNMLYIYSTNGTYYTTMP